jgi:hypothetical protein
MIQLNEQQRKAAGFEGKHLLVLAGPVSRLRFRLKEKAGECLSSKSGNSRYATCELPVSLQL